MPEVTVSEWGQFLASKPQAHLLQTAAWGELKAEFGWQPLYIVSGESTADRVGAQVLFRRLPLGASLAYIPKGPVGGLPRQEYAAWKELWPEVDRACRQRRTIFLKVEADLWEPPAGKLQGSQALNDHFGLARPEPPEGFCISPQSIQPRRTLVVSLAGDEEAILGRMRQKTRYNIRLAQKKGVVVYPGDDVGTFYRLMRVTGERDAFGVHTLDYYQKACTLFAGRRECVLLIAEYEQEPLAAIMVFARGSRAWYFYGASSNAHRERMPAYLLQWEAMRWARGQGCAWYDLWGVPDADEQTLEANFSSRSDGLWGVYRFKRGFGGQLMRAPAAWDRVYNAALYKMYGWWAHRRHSQGD
jgi:lipid II:glycine glycyltransferase (peptidoglycan interpeptide bridge formation enzyme)